MVNNLTFSNHIIGLFLIENSFQVIFLVLIILFELTSLGKGMINMAIEWLIKIYIFIFLRINLIIRR